jgi:perosamine synthetase
MAVTDDQALADRMRLMSLPGLSHDAWERYRGGRSWDYRIMAPGFKYNLTDIAAAIGLQQLQRAEEMRLARDAVTHRYQAAFSSIDEIDLPPEPPDRIHSWHLYPIRLRLDQLSIDRNAFIEALQSAGVGCSVPLAAAPLHPYYEETFGWRPRDLPVATAGWRKLVSLPIFPGMREEEIHYVIETVEELCKRHSKPLTAQILAPR